MNTSNTAACRTSNHHTETPCNYVNSRFFLAIAALVAVWLGAIIVLAENGRFHTAPQTPPLAMLTAISVPPMLFLLLLRTSPKFKREILAIDPVWLTAIHGLRILGAGFLFVASFGHLPDLFARPAGWGDVLVAVLAPFVTVKLARNRDFITSPWLWRFHFLGMLDFVGAIGSGLLARGAIPAFSGPVTTAALGDLPLALIPGFAVPLWICLHLAAFLQIRAARRNFA